MPVAQGHGELVRDFEAERAALGKANVVGLRRPATANEAGLVGDEGKASLVADALFLGKGQLAGRVGLGCQRRPD